MNRDDFKVGAVFLYSGNPNESTQFGLGKVITVDSGDVEIEWLWSPQNTMYCQKDWYQNEHRESWEMYCTLISEKEKFSLLLKHNFG